MFSDRLLRPGDAAYFDIIHAFNGYRTCYYRTFVVGRATQAQRDAFKQAREWIDGDRMVKPGNTTDQIAQVWPEGAGIRVRRRDGRLRAPVRPRRRYRPPRAADHLPAQPLDEPIEIKEGMYFALETYAPAGDGRSAARIEEMMVVTAEGPQVTTLFPCEELMVANEY